uniref:AT hook containing transcription factor 1 n=1 Tax=Astyanax mexicanus TaxID=7994 RepID=A0A3B1J9N6_ASTMX
MMSVRGSVVVLGLVGLMNKSMVSSLISQYAQVVLWFCRTGLLPESSDDDLLQISRPFYSFSVIKNYYTGQREELQRLAKDKWSADCLMIDGLVAQCGDRVSELWRRDEGGNGQYPPPSLHALLDLYLLENLEESVKHAIVIYLLLDVMYSFPNKSGASVESFPTAFAIPIGLVKLVQGLWLLDHHDHENSLELLLHPSTSQSVWAWQHGRVLEALMCQGKHSIALRYLHVMKPSVNSTNQTKLCLSVLLHNRCMVEAWAMLRQHANKLNLEELLRFLYETCQELDLMKDLLKLPLGPLEQECLERFLQSTGGFQNRELLMVHYLQQANYVPALQINQTLKVNLAADRDPKMKERSNTRNSILNQYGKVLPRAQRKLAIERSKPYQHPTTILREVSRPQPLSAVAKRSATESVLTRAAFIKNVLTKIEEVWVGKDATPEPSPHKSPREPEVLVPSPTPPTLQHVPEAFVGTPINMLTKRMSRLFDLVVQPCSQASPEASQVLGTPPRSISSWAAPKSITKAPELSLLQTPQVVKRARALAAAAPVFSSFTPQSILRSSLRPTPVATPSASPGRSVTPPLRSKESRITFMEKTASPELPKSSVRWSNGLSAADGEMIRLKKLSSPPEGGVEAWSEHSGEDEVDAKDGSFAEREKPKEEVEEAESHGGLLAPPTLLGRPSLGLETSGTSIQSDTTLEFHDAPSPGDVDRRTLQRHTVEAVENSVDEEVVVKLAEETAEPAHTSSTEGGTTEELPAESPAVEEAELKDKHEVIGEGEEPNLEPEVVTPEEPLVTEEFQPAPQEPITEPSVEAEEPISEPPGITLIEGSVPAPPEEQPIVEASIMETEPINESPAVEEPSIMPEQPINESTVNHELSGEGHTPQDEVKNEAEAMETSDVDEYVERHLFGSDLSPPLTRSGIKESSDTWTSFNSEPGNDGKEAELVVSDAVDAAATDAQKSVSSSEAATSESRSVVSLNDSEELSSVESEEEESDKEEEEEEEQEEEEEDSGSEVEIIEEVKGRPHPPAPALFLEELPPDEQFLQEQEATVLSLVDPDAQLKMMDGVMEEEDEEEGEVVMVGLEPADLVEDADGQVCYTELKPSTTLLVPLELAPEHQDLLDGGALQGVAEGEQEEELPGGSKTFSLVLDAGDDEEEPVPVPAELDPNNHLVLQQEDELIDDLASRPGADPEVLCLLEEPEQQLVDHAEEMEDEPSVKVHEPDVLSTLSAPDVEEQPKKLEEQPEEKRTEETEMIEVPMVESAPAEELLAHSHLNEGQENGDVAESESTKVDEPSEEMVEPSSLTITTPTEVHQEDVSTEDHASDTSKLKDSKESSPKTVEPMEASKTAEEHPEPPSEVETNKEEPVETIKEVQKSPSRRGRKTVTFPLPVTESEKDLSEEDSKVPSTPRRVTRSGKQLQDSQVPVTPRRSARKAEPELPIDGDLEVPSTRASKPSSPSRTPQKGTPRKGTRRTRSTNVESDEDNQPMEDQLNNSRNSNTTAPQVRQSARKSQKAFVDVPEPVPEVPEVPELSESAEVAIPVPNEKAPEQPPKTPASPSRVTRKSTRGLSLALDSFQKDLPEDTVAPNRVSGHSAKKPKKEQGGNRGEDQQRHVHGGRSSAPERLPTPDQESDLSHEDEQKKEEENLVLENAESVNPLANALMERLKEEGAEEKEGGTAAAAVTEIVRARRRTTRSTAPPTVTESQNEDVVGSVEEEISNEVQETQKKPSARRTRASRAPEPEPKPDSSPVRESAAASSSVLLRTRGGKKKDTVKPEISVSDLLLSPPATRTRRAAATSTSTTAAEDLQPENNDLEMQEEEIKPKKRTTRTKAAPEPVPPVEVDLVSPLASPADPPARDPPPARGEGGGGA